LCCRGHKKIKFDQSGGGVNIFFLFCMAFYICWKIFR
jgi:hypothetical protein